MTLMFLVGNKKLLTHSISPIIAGWLTLIYDFFSIFCSRDREGCTVLPFHSPPSPIRRMKWCNGIGHKSWVMVHVGHGSINCVMGHMGHGLRKVTHFHLWHAELWRNLTELAVNVKCVFFNFLDFAHRLQCSHTCGSYSSSLMLHSQWITKHERNVLLNDF